MGRKAMGKRFLGVERYAQSQDLVIKLMYLLLMAFGLSGTCNFVEHSFKPGNNKITDFSGEILWDRTGRV
ncbi:MAG: hypothetical protein NPIRA03_18840 [Nitrospirales bacterium]|nr:MAG: hypothetical protein NPIRA03_18840 [Nitrospirales bacterium]